MINIEMISYKNWKEDIRDFISEIDFDACGINGKEYLMEEAKEQGFKCNLDYWINLADKNNKEIYYKVNDVLNSLDNTYTSYKYHEFEIKEVAEDFMIVAIALKM